jgi:hypothetical protein
MLNASATAEAARILVSLVIGLFLLVGGGCVDRRSSLKNISGLCALVVVLSYNWIFHGSTAVFIQ